jgi:hypothetical protein
MALAPEALQSLATIGTAMELAGTAAPGGSAHLLGAACLLVSSQQAWNDEDPRVHSAAAGLLQVRVIFLFVCNKLVQQQQQLSLDTDLRAYSSIQLRQAHCR